MTSTTCRHATAKIKLKIKQHNLRLRNNIILAILMNPHVLIAEEEKIIIDDGGDPTMLQEK
jgi:hypothetical protein